MSTQPTSITRESIETALVLLLEDQELEEIDIKTLTEKAGVSRSTFYRNYSSKENVLEQYMYHLLTSIDSMGWTSVGEDAGFENYWRTMFREWQKNRRVAEILIKGDFFDKLLDGINRISDRYYPTKPRWPRYREYLLYGAMSNITKEWIRAGMQESPDEMAHFCSHILKGLEGRYTGDQT